MTAYNINFIDTIPSQNSIENSSTQSYNYIINPFTTPNVIEDKVSTTISRADLSSFYMDVDKVYAGCSEVITYTMTLGYDILLNIYLIKIFNKIYF